MKKQLTAFAVSGMLAMSSAFAGEVGATTTFFPDTPAKAAEVNGNFQALIAAINDNAQRIADLEADLSDNLVSDRTYRLFSFNAEVLAGDSDSDGFKDFASVGPGSLDASLVFNPATDPTETSGTGTLTINDDTYHELNFPNYNFDPTTEDQFPKVLDFDYVQSGSEVVLTVYEDLDTFQITLVVSGDGSTVMSRVVEVDNQASLQDGNATGVTGFTELLIGIKL